jgi:hypothetical protein
MPLNRDQIIRTLGALQHKVQSEFAGGEPTSRFSQRALLVRARR